MPLAALAEETFSAASPGDAAAEYLKTTSFAKINNCGAPKTRRTRPGRAESSRRSRSHSLEKTNFAVLLSPVQSLPPPYKLRLMGGIWLTHCCNFSSPLKARSAVRCAPRGESVTLASPAVFIKMLSLHPAPICPFPLPALSFPSTPGHSMAVTTDAERHFFFFENKGGLSTG